VALDPVDIGLRQVNTTTRPLHDISGRHDAARDSGKLTVYYVGDEQL
jgi:hypothetical protein